MKQVFFIDEIPKTLPEWLTQAILDGRVVVRGDSTSDHAFYVVNGQIATTGQSLVYDGIDITIN